MQVAGTLVPLLKFYFHEEVRKAAVSGIRMIVSVCLLLVSDIPLDRECALSYYPNCFNVYHFQYLYSNAGAFAICKISYRERAISRSGCDLFEIFD